MKEQIVEMAKIIAVQRGYDCAARENCDASCIVYKCHPYAYAEILYNAGYRKQSEPISCGHENGVEWISVTERLPENDYGKHWKERKHYLVMTEPSGLMRVARFGYKEHLWWVDSHDTVMTSVNYAKVTHWMPLPQPPEMKGGAE